MKEHKQMKPAQGGTSNVIHLAVNTFDNSLSTKEKQGLKRIPLPASMYPKDAFFLMPKYTEVPHDNI